MHRLLRDLPCCWVCGWKVVLGAEGGLLMGCHGGEIEVGRNGGAKRLAAASASLPCLEVLILGSLSKL